MRDAWQRRIDRVDQLAEADEIARPLLLTYGRLLGLQRDCYVTLGRSHLTGSADRDLPVLRSCVRPMLRGVATLGSPSLAGEALHLLESESAIDDLLVAGWREPSGHPFFPKVVFQPYAEHLAAIKLRPAGRVVPDEPGACPFCGGRPQLSVLESAEDAAGGGRRLLCAICLTTWPFRRIVCAHCGEEDEHRLSYYHSPAFDHLRVDACETCRYYLKTVDLTRLGIAVPLVDEVAGASLDLWAREHGYQKIELNLVGL